MTSAYVEDRVYQAHRFRPDASSDVTLHIGERDASKVTGGQSSDVNLEAIWSLQSAPALLVEQSLGPSNQINWAEIDQEAYDANPVEFAHAWEEEFARCLDAFGIDWQYKPRTFAVEWDDDGNFIDSLTPDFYLTARDLYIELAASDCGVCTAKALKVRLLRQHHSDVNIELVYAAEFTTWLRGC